MSDAELEALEVGPYIQRTRELTPEDRATGMHGRTVTWLEMRPVRATAYYRDDIFAWRDSNGRLWDFGQFADGQWFKQRSVLD